VRKNVDQLKQDTEDHVTLIIGRLDKQKEKQNDLSIKNSRLWQKEQVRLKHDKIMQERKKEDDANEKTSCETQRIKGTIIFPAIEISSEVELDEDTTCIDTNRDELLKSFCSFRMDLDELFEVQGIVDKQAKTFWPNICCKERKDKTLEVCEDSTGKIKREKIIPFALSQGGDYSRHNLYAEVKDSIEMNGYIHDGMNQLIDSLDSSDGKWSKKAKKNLTAFFKEVSLCGPRIVDAPNSKDTTKLCELFVPYKHTMSEFYKLIKQFFVTDIPEQDASSSFLEMMEKSLRKRSAVKRVGKNQIQQMMQMKPKMPKVEEEKCTGKVDYTSDELVDIKLSHCKGYKHLDLSNTNMKNVAVHYLKNDIPEASSYKNKKMFEFSEQLRYQITDTSCPAPLFTADDISIQRVAMDTLGKKKEWVAVVNLNTKSEKGYLQSELPSCKRRNYLISSKVEVKAYVDKGNCCNGLKDFKKCSEPCQNKLEAEPLEDRRTKSYSKNVIVTGSEYYMTDSRLTNSHLSEKRRRKLLKNRGGHFC
jgi:hypothetical protein